MDSSVHHIVYLHQMDQILGIHMLKNPQSCLTRSPTYQYLDSQFWTEAGPLQAGEHAWGHLDVGLDRRFT